MRTARLITTLWIAALTVGTSALAGCGGALAPLGVTVTAEPVDGRAPLQVTFTALLVGDEGESGVTYDWDFGDGTANDAAEAPSHLFADGGSYEVSVTVTRNDDDFVAVGTISITVEPNSDPTVVADATPDVGLEPLTVTFTAFVTGGDGSISYTWDFGDGSTSSLPNPIHTYTTAGSYDATVTVVDDDGDTASDMVSIAVGSDDIPAPTAMATPDTGSAPLVVDFDCTAIGGNAPLTFQWDFGDGASTSLAAATHTYTSSGVYVATCIVTDSDGSTGSDSVTITIASDTAPTAIASATYLGNAAPLTVDFVGIGLGGDAPLTYDWDFGDGNQSTTQNPQHIYTAPGNYAAILTVTDADGDFDVDTVTIIVGTGSVPVATANANPTVGDAPLAVTFTGTGIGGDGTLTYMWDFGDGNTSTLQSPTHTYTADGIYAAILTVTDQDGDFDVDNVTITVGTDSFPVATAAATPTSGDNPLTVNFTGSGIGGDAPLTYAWDFGDGNTSTLQSPMHTYTMDGSFVAILTVTDVDGDFDVDTVVIDVATDLVPTATASAMPTTGTVPLPVVFTGTGTGGDLPLSYSWTFGDGVTSPLQNPNHTYMASGVFDATLTVTDADGDFDQDTVQITVNPVPGNAPPTGTITVNTTCAQPGVTQIQLDASGFTDPEMAPLGYSWVFVTVPPGSTAAFNNTTVVSPTFTPDLEGTYELRCFVSDGVNNVASNIVTVTAGNPSTLTPLTGDGQNAEAGQPFPGPFSVNATNVCGLAISGWSIDWTGSNATPVMPSTLTDGAGDTTNDAIAGITLGAATVTATAAGTGVSYVFTMLTVDPGPPNVLVADFPTDTPVNGPMVLTFTVYDQFGNVSPNTPVDFDLCQIAGGGTVTFDAPLGMGGISGCNSYTTAGGTASVDIYGQETEDVAFQIIPMSAPLNTGMAANVFSDDLEAGDDGMWNTFINGVAEDWELGTPTSVGPAGAFSGSNAWGTDLDANYMSGIGGFFLDDSTTLERTIDLTGFTSPFGPTMVLLRDWEYIDANPDAGGCPAPGGAVRVLEGSCGFVGCGPVIQPDRGWDFFPCTQPGNSGNTAGWIPVQYDLSPFVSGNSVTIHWSLGRGGSATTGAGWYVDDINVDVIVPDVVAGTFLPGPPDHLLVTNVTPGVLACADARLEVSVVDAFDNPTGTDTGTQWDTPAGGTTIIAGPDVGMSFMPITPWSATMDTVGGVGSMFLADGSLTAFADDFETGVFGPDWTTFGNANWVVSPAPPIGGAFSARSGLITHNQSTTLETTLPVAAPGMVTFDYEVSSEASFDFLEFYIDGVLQNSWSGIGVAGNAAFPIGPGVHTFTWVYTKDGSVNSGADAVWIDDVIVDNVGAPVSTSTDVTDPTGTLGPANALVDFLVPTVDEIGLCGDGADNDCDGMADCQDPDCTGAPGCDFFDDFEAGAPLGPDWTTFGNAPWNVTSTLPLGGMFSAESGNIGNNQNSGLEINLNYFAPGTIDFEWSVSTEGAFDFLRFYIDGMQMMSESGTNGGFASFPVGPGPHTMTWEYTKDGSVSTGLDAVFIDNVFANGGAP